MIDIRRAADRFRTVHSGITSWHSFSSGPHYDESNVAFGPLIACDEHLLDPGAGFDRHPHARVELVSWVVDGVLLHCDGEGRERHVVAGKAQYQSAGIGIEHTERNASSTEPLQFVQFWLLTDEDVPDYDCARPPLRLSTGRFSVLRRCSDEAIAAAPFVHLFVARGRYRIGADEIVAGDSVRCADSAMTVSGDGELLVLTLG